MAKKAAKLLVAGMSCADAAALLGCSRAHVSYLISEGELRAQRVVGRVMLVDPASVVAYSKNPKRRNRGPAKATKKVAKKVAKKKTAARKGHG